MTTNKLNQNRLETLIEFLALTPVDDKFSLYINSATGLIFTAYDPGSSTGIPDRILGHQVRYLEMLTGIDDQSTTKFPVAIYSNVSHQRLLDHSFKPVVNFDQYCSFRLD